MVRRSIDEVIHKPRCYELSGSNPPKCGLHLVPLEPVDFWIEGKKVDFWRCPATGMVVD